MDALPPNDPNNNDNHRNVGGGGASPTKEAPHDGSRRTGGGRDGQPMDIVGDLSDSPAVVIMFLVTVAGWFLRERCVC